MNPFKSFQSLSLVKIFTLFFVITSLLFTSQAHALQNTPVPRTVMVHLFEWKWNDIANECENYLGPKGFSAVQVSPPQKSISGNQWWTRYQPLSYAIEGRSGTRAEFASMVARCKVAGVDIYVDAVINHMAALNRDFPEVPYGVSDFHTCTAPIDYSNAWSVQNCDLSGLNDLKTESDYVRQKIADYLNGLTGLGVAGFRFDAAKHMQPADISDIVSRMSGHPYIYQEVIRGGSEPVQPEQYTYIAAVTEFNYSRTVSYFFKGRGTIKSLANIGTNNWNGWLASRDAQVFVENHDNQRQETNNIITYKDGANLNTLAHVFMLAWPYGYPQVMSSYSWDNSDQGPPNGSANSCTNGWLCEHRIRAIANMVSFANNTNKQFRVTNYWDNGNNQMAWGRGGTGFIAINREDSLGLRRTFSTGMAAGIYCDIIHADFNYKTGSCNGATVTVDVNGNATFLVSTHDAVAFHVGAVVGVPCLNCGGDIGRGNSISSIGGPSSSSNNNWYFRGTPNNWGLTPMSLSAGSTDFYCTQQAFGDVNTNPRFKIDHYGDWSESYPTADFSVSVNTAYNICINTSNHVITLIAVKSPANSSNSKSSVGSSLSSSRGLTSSNSSSSKTNTVVHFTCNNGQTYFGQSIYVIGNIDTLGNWAPAAAVKLNPTNYPTWTGDIQLPANTDIQWKCLKREEANAANGVEWQAGGNNVINTASGVSAIASF